MTLPQTISLAILAGLLILFVWDRLRFDMVALLALLASVALGIVPANKAFSGFSNPLLPLIAAALVVSNAVGKSGLIEQVVHFMRPLLQRRSGTRRWRVIWPGFRGHATSPMLRRRSLCRAIRCCPRC